MMVVFLDFKLDLFCALYFLGIAGMAQEIQETSSKIVAGYGI